MNRIDATHVKSRHDCRDVARLLGLKPRGSGSHLTVRCPVHDDRTPSCSVAQDVWHCHSCKAAGDVIDLVQEALGVGFTEACEWLGEGQELPPVEHKPKGYPPADDLADLEHATTKLEGTDAGRYLEGRGLLVEGLDLVAMARALTAARVPSWASWWWRAGYRVVCWLYDSSGTRRSVLGRSIKPQQVKSRTPKGYAARGLAFACPVALRWLRGELEPARIVVAEGEIDWLSARHHARAKTAVLGMRSGTFTPDWRERMRPGQTWVIATDEDEAGERYARELSGMVRAQGAQALRWRG